MHPTPREKLRQIIERYGPDVSLDARRCEAFLRDLCGDFRKEIFVLTSAAREGIPQALRATIGMPISALLAFHSKQMHENLGISEDLCTWAVETWAFALGVVAANEVRPETHCPACDVKIRIPQRLYGRQAKCPKCLTPLMISVAGVPALRLQPDEPAVFAAPSVSEQEFGPTFAEIVPEQSESAEDVFRQVVSQTIQTSGSFQPEHLPHLDQARSSLGLSYDTSRRIINEVAVALLPAATRRQSTHARNATRDTSVSPIIGKQVSPPPIAADAGKSVPQLNGPPPIINNLETSAGQLEAGISWSEPTMFIGKDSWEADWSSKPESSSAQVGGIYAPISFDEVRRKVARPATGLIVTGMLTTLVGFLLFAKLSADELPRDNIAMVTTGLPILISLTLGVVTLLGSFKMLNLESYPLAMTAAIVAMVPCYCCVLGLPMGIWAVNVLGEQDVKLAFMRRSNHHT